MKKRKTIPWQPLSQKHKEYIRRCMDCTFNFAEGAVRSGKTTANVLAFSYLLEKSPDRLHLATGTTLSAALTNIGDCNGFGLEHIFRGRCRWGKYKGNAALFVKTLKKGEKTVVFAGGGKADSYKRIRGNSYGIWIATEVNRHFISGDDRCFIDEAFNRQLAAKMRRVLWDFNPDYPTHPIYTGYVDKYIALGLDVNHERFCIRDNLSVSPQRRAEIEAQYEVGSFWYRRAILGERAAAEGLIFPQFASAPEKWTVSSVPDDVSQIIIGVDYGGNSSASAFVAIDMKKDGNGVIVLRDRRIRGRKGEITPDMIEDEFILFVKTLYDNFDIPVTYAFMDSEAQYLTAGVVMAARKAGLKLAIADSVKKPIAERIAIKSRLISQHRWSVLDCCKNVIASTATQMWDPYNPDRRLDNGSCDIDTADAEEYAWERFIRW
ncbi:MAG: PBSX family phage terminase large subunit [Clostridia bacterium]|nr:PBSX family phage terminase large subunit [Clostridia bacterium]